MSVNTVISELIATGKAQYGEYVGTGALQVIPIPKGKGMVITNITLKAFADLPVGSDFREGNNWDTRHAWHQLRVIGQKSVAMYKARHDLRNVTRAGVNYLLPYGEHSWGCFLNHERDVLIELSHAPIISNYTTVQDRLPNAVFNFKPPGGYGHLPGGEPATQYLRNIVSGFEVRPFNTYTPPLAGVATSFSQNEWHIKADTILNPPLPAIVFGEYTIPEVRVQFIYFNKNTNFTFSANAKP